MIIPVFNEQEAIQDVLGDLPDGILHETIVVDNGSTDHTARLAADLGARVIQEPRRGYGSACLAGIVAADSPEIFAFLDGDYSDFPEELGSIVAPILRGQADVVIGSRVLGEWERNALLPQARFGNWLATHLIEGFFGMRFTDLGPFRAVTRRALQQMRMEDRTFGWTVEMQVKAALLRIRVQEVPVRYRRRIGVSKITGTLSGTLGAGYKILLTIFKHAARPDLLQQ